MKRKLDTYFYQSQRAWIEDHSPLKILVKSRQTGFSWCNSFRLVRLVSARGARLDAYISSRDQGQARLQVDDCRHWAELMNIGFTDLGEVLLDGDTNASAYVLQFANGRRIYSLSSNPNALAGKRGHVTLDEFALHTDQRLLYRVAKPVTTWGGQLSIISTHRGHGSVFNQIIRDIKERGNPMGWSLHTVPIQAAVEAGLVEKINYKSEGALARKLGFEIANLEAPHAGLRTAWLGRVRAECLDEAQWLQEYCCTPADESSAFITFELLAACEDPEVKLMSIDELEAW